MSCFRREVILYDSKDTLFQETFLNACYLITMEKSKRRSQYMKQLDTYKPFHKVQIIHNKGWRKCQKSPRIQNTVDDLSDVYAQIFLECLHKKLDNVLVFEDDFFFANSVECIHESIQDIQMFLLHHSDYTTYNLGAIPLFMFPESRSMNHYYYKGVTAHSVVYSKDYMVEYVSHYETMNCLSDLFWNRFKNNYTYHKPLCFQLFPKTENSTNWSSIVDTQPFMAYAFKADRTHEYLFPFMYTFAKTWYIIVLLMLFKRIGNR